MEIGRIGANIVSDTGSVQSIQGLYRVPGINSGRADEHPVFFLEERNEIGRLSCFHFRVKI